MIQRRTFLAAAAAVIVSSMAFLKKAKAVEKTYGPIQLGKIKSIPFPSGGVFASHEELEELSVVIRRQHNAACDSLARQWENYLWGSP